MGAQGAVGMTWLSLTLSLLASFTAVSPAVQSALRAPESNAHSRRLAPLQLHLLISSDQPGIPRALGSLAHLKNCQRLVSYSIGLKHGVLIPLRSKESLIILEKKKNFFFLEINDSFQLPAMSEKRGIYTTVFWRTRLTEERIA